MTDFANKIKEPFLAEDIEWRVQQAGLYNETKASGARGWALVLAYVTNRAIMQRLDDVCGPENWRNEFADAPDGGVLCGISIRFNKEWITKWDGADKTDIESTKGGLSNAMKRAAVQWGIGRYLYNLESNFVNLYEGKERGKFHHYDKNTKKRYYWNAPQLPEWALPEPEPQAKGGNNDSAAA